MKFTNWIGLLSVVSAIVIPEYAYAEELGSEGVGLMPCALFSKAYQQDPKRAEELTFSWTEGFLTAYNTYKAENVPLLDLSRMSTENKQQFLNNYCDAHPLKRYADGVFDLMQQLRSNTSPP